jgi:prokaryotic ubiquitin-like protein Pup
VTRPAAALRVTLGVEQVPGHGGRDERSWAHLRALGRARPDDDAAPVASTVQSSRPLLDDVDGLLDEIDAVLEVNAEEFVRGYVQKGGE